MNNKRQIVKKYSEVVTNVEDVQIIKSKYDELCKKVLSNKYILAWILKSVVKEYELEGIETIREKYIEGVVDCSKKLISSQSKCMEIEGRRNENLILGEGVRIFDIVFAAITPISHDKLIVNIEPQNEYYPGYVIDTRMIYYLARMISSQYGKEFNKSNYNDIKKVYSIWVCTDSPKGEANSISIYEMNRRDFVGKQKDRRKSYNKMIGIKICLGGEQEKNYTGVIKLLHVLLVSNISIEEKNTG